MDSSRLVDNGAPNLLPPFLTDYTQSKSDYSLMKRHNNFFSVMLVYGNDLIILVVLVYVDDLIILVRTNLLEFQAVNYFRHQIKIKMIWRNSNSFWILK